MADYCRVTVVGNLGTDIRVVRVPGESGEGVGVSSICVAQTWLQDGELMHTTTAIPLEIRGTTRASRAAQLFGAGSRIVIDGHLELRGGETEERLRFADGRGEATVIVPRTMLVLVADTLLNADLPLSTPEAQRHLVAHPWPGTA